MFAYTNDFNTLYNLAKGYIELTDGITPGCARFTLTSNSDGVNGALNIKDYGDVMDADFNCDGNRCYLSFNGLGDIPVYLTYVDDTNHILLMGVCNQDLVTLALYVATATGYEIDQTYLDAWNMFSSFFSTANVQGVFAFA